MEELNETSIAILTSMAEAVSLNKVEDCRLLPQSGSRRRYYRIYLSDNKTIIGAYNEDITENKAFFAYTDFFHEKNLNVPKILSVHSDEKHYLLNDLGTETLYGELCYSRENGLDFSSIVALYEKVVAQLPLFQLTAKQGLDMSVAYPRAAFDRQSMQWDLNYFKYYYLKMVNIPFNEQLLEDDYQLFMDYLLSAESDYFLYRDFQSRNIMVKDNEVYFIDYQGGRAGALQYDIASLLYDAKADLSQELRNILLERYLDSLSKHIEVDRDKFKAYFNAFALIRIMQAMGAYGYRGYFERKSHFLQSIPYAIKNLKYLIPNSTILDKLPELKNVLQTVVDSYKESSTPKGDVLTIEVNSFSYKKGIPEDKSGNGGGFVFDCRALPNPGREKKYANNTGKDECVKAYLNNYKEVHFFENQVFNIIDASVNNYLERKFNHLMVNFGCTGGQHRSVFFAEETAKHLRETFPMANVVVKHTNLDK